MPRGPCAEQSDEQTIASPSHPAANTATMHAHTKAPGCQQDEDRHNHSVFNGPLEARQYR